MTSKPQTVSVEPAAMPSATELTGRLVTLVPLDPAAHTTQLYTAVQGHTELWKYLFDEPPVNENEFRAALMGKTGKPDPFFFTILDRHSKAPLGIACYLRIEPLHRVIEVGNILFSPLMQRTAHATEAMYLMARHVFEDLGYRRYEWKCNALNEPSRRAALRLGFQFEGIFRQHMIVKGESRDTAWFGMIDADWPACRAAFERWLDVSNFDEHGKQKRTLASLRD